MRFLRLVILCAALSTALNASGQEIQKIVKGYVLINIDATSGYIAGDEIQVLRHVGQNQNKTVGKVKLIKYAQGKCAGKIISQKKNDPIRIGDFIKMSYMDKKDNSKNVSVSGSGESVSIGIEKGDSEISFMGFYAKMVGTEFETGGTGAFNLSLAYFVSRNLQLGFAPQLMIYQGMMGATYTIFSFSAFASYNFQTASKFIPYVTAKWYQSEVAPGESDFMENAYLTFGGGFRNFFNEYASLNTSISYGFNLGGREETILTIMSGVSILFNLRNL